MKNACSTPAMVMNSDDSPKCIPGQILRDEEQRASQLPRNAPVRENRYSPAPEPKYICARIENSCVRLTVLGEEALRQEAVRFGVVLRITREGPGRAERHKSSGRARTRRRHIHRRVLTKR